MIGEGRGQRDGEKRLETQQESEMCVSKPSLSPSE